MTHLPRRAFLKSTLVLAVVSTAGAAGLLSPYRTFAADLPRKAFDAKKLDEVVQAAFGASQMAPSPSVKLTAPLQAENSAQVQIQVVVDLPAVEEIAVIVEKNPVPLIAHASLSGTATSYFSTRVRMAQTSDVYAVAKVGGKLYFAKQTVDVTASGCAG